MKLVYIALAATVAGGMANWVSPAGAQGAMPMDSPTTIGGIETVCTGIGQEAQQDPRWLSYPVRIEFSNGGAQYLSGAHIDLSTAGGKSLASFNCDGSWVLFRLEPGTYKVTATLTGQQGGTSSATFSPPRNGQKRVVLDFSVKPNQ